MKKAIDLVFLGASALAFALCAIVAMRPAYDHLLVPLVWVCVGLVAALAVWITLHVWSGTRL